MEEELDLRPIAGYLVTNSGEHSPVYDKVVWNNIVELASRSTLGITKYGVTLDNTDANWDRHLLEELLDAANYVRRIMLDKTSTIVKKKRR